MVFFEIRFYRLNSIRVYSFYQAFFALRVLRKSKRKLTPPLVIHFILFFILQNNLCIRPESFNTNISHQFLLST